MFFLSSLCHLSVFVIYCRNLSPSSVGPSVTARRRHPQRPSTLKGQYNYSILKNILTYVWLNLILMETFWVLAPHKCKVLRYQMCACVYFTVTLSLVGLFLVIYVAPASAINASTVQFNAGLLRSTRHTRLK